jgi:DNA repair exonuclease SbcCD ATPase subunit
MSEEADIQPVEEEAKPSLAGRVGRFFLRVFVIITLGVVIGMAIYFGVPALYRDFVEPTRRNTEQVVSLQRSLDQVREGVQQQAEENAQRLADLEGRLAQHSETLSELQVDQASLQSDLEQNRTELEDLEPLADRIDQLEDALSQASDELRDMQDQLEAIGEPTADLEFQLKLTQSMTLLTRAQLWLSQDNLGLASEDVQSALDILATVGFGADMDSLSQIEQRLSLVLEQIRINPELASEELETAWTLLVGLLEPDTSPEEPIPLPTPREDIDESS